jgi:UDPglucose 6-dehydrogenase
MNIAIAGFGYVGLVHAACLADTGHAVVCIDTDEDRVQMLNAGICPIYEPGLKELLLKNKEKLRYTTDFAGAYAQADASLSLWERRRSLTVQLT